MTYKATKKKKKSFKKPAIVVALVLMIGGTTVYTLRNILNVPYISDPEKAENRPGNDINLNPPSQQEKAETEKFKDSTIENQNPSNSTPTLSSDKKNSVIPTITNATDRVVNSLVSSIFEEGGTCTATFTKNSEILTKTSVGFQNVSYTQCAPMNLEAGFLNTGKWTVVVKYVSDKSEGSSNPQIIEVN